MYEKKSFLEEIIASLEELNGSAPYKELYKKLYERNILSFSNFKNDKNWKACVRATIERNSSDSKVFCGNDIFYSVDGLGKGHWGLRKYQSEVEKFKTLIYEQEFPEGKEIELAHKSKERNSKAARLAKEKFKKDHGSLYCEACNLSFEKVYGELGKDYIEAHHNHKPVSDMSDDHKTKISDYVMLCSNCHRMIHRKRPWISMKELKTLIQNNNKK